MKSWRSVLTLCFFAVLPALHSLAQSPQPQPLVVTVTPWGPGQAAIDTAEAMVSNSTVVLRYLQGTRNRLLSLQLLGAASALHHRLHPNSASPDHQCVVTLVSHGQIHHATAEVALPPAHSVPAALGVRQFYVFLVVDYRLLPGRAPPVVFS